MSGERSAFPRLPIVIGEKKLLHLAECELASCPLVGRVVSCLRTTRALMSVNKKPNPGEKPIKYGD